MTTEDIDDSPIPDPNQQSVTPLEQLAIFNLSKPEDQELFTRIVRARGITGRLTDCSRAEIDHLEYCFLMRTLPLHRTESPL